MGVDTRDLAGGYDRATRIAAMCVAAAAVGLAPRLSSAQDPRFPPRPVRDAVLGCWDLGAGTTLRLDALGRHSATYRARFAVRPRGGPAVMTGLAVWVSVDAAFEVACRPRSQHGSFCRVAPVASGLQVRVFALRHGAGRRGALTQDFVAPRCAPRARPNP